MDGWWKECGFNVASDTAVGAVAGMFRGHCAVQNTYTYASCTDLPGEVSRAVCVTEAVVM